MKKTFYLLFLVLLFANQGQGQTKTPVYATDEDKAIFENYKSAMREYKNLPLGDLVVKTALFFEGKPYVASTLEKEPEGLVINLREFDCTTLVENSLALAMAMKMDEPSFETFCNCLKHLRYRENEVSYTARLHYFSDWIFENQQKSLVRDVSQTIGGTPYSLNLSFMSMHPDSYKQLKSNPEYVQFIREKEKEISARDSYSYIPDKEIDKCSLGMKNGDVVCFVTNVEGLDISHVGIVYKKGEVVTFIHASSTAKRVIINPVSIHKYVGNTKRNIGVMIVRPIDASFEAMKQETLSH